MTIILILVLCIVFGFALAGVLAPIIILKNRKILAEMREVIAHYEYNKTQGFAKPEAARRETMARLIRLKSKIFIGDKRSLEEAKDLISMF